MMAVVNLGQPWTLVEQRAKCVEGGVTEEFCLGFATHTASPAAVQDTSVVPTVVKVPKRSY